MKGTLLKTGFVAAGLTASLTVVDLKPAEAMGFSGYYDPANWTFTNNNTNGFVDTSLAPAQITLTGGDSPGSGSGSTLYTILADKSGIFKFDWSYFTTDVGGPLYDPFVVINNIQTQLTDNFGSSSQLGSYSQFVAAGTQIGFGILTTDNILGSASVTVSDFEVAAIPTPALLPGLVGLGVAALRKKQKEAAAE